MRKKWQIGIIAITVVCAISTQASDTAARIKKAIERSTLNQSGTKPFHLKAELAPSLERDKESGRTGTVEIWWASPTRWRREVHSAQFHQIEIVDGDHDWQKNEGDYFPEWLRQVAIELIRPVPPLDDVLEHAKSAEIRNFSNPVNPAFSQLNIDWATDTGTPEVHNISRSYVAINPNTGLLLYAGGLGWGGGFKDYGGFHGRMVARTVDVGSPGVTARVRILDDLGEVPPGFFDATAPGGDPNPLHTAVIDEISLRKNLLPEEPFAWPHLENGVLEGNVATTITVDRDGKVRNAEVMVSENMGIADAGRQRILAMRFKPFIQNGAAVQVVSQITVPFKTTRPIGSEAFESARSYFEKGRRLNSLAAGSDRPYVLHGDFTAKSTQGGIVTGKYEDTWLDRSHWRREVSFGQSRYIRSRNGEKWYQSGEGQDENLLRFVLKTLEPIPAVDTFTESDWRIKRDQVNGTRAIRVLTGYESTDGKLDSSARGYWFDDSGLLLKTYLAGIETQWSNFEAYNDQRIARHIDVLKDGKLAMQIRLTEISPAGTIPESTLMLKGHEWQRAFTAEER